MTGRLTDHQIWLAQRNLEPVSPDLRMLYARALGAYADALFEIHQREIDALVALSEDAP